MNSAEETQRVNTRPVVANKSQHVLGTMGKCPMNFSIMDANQIAHHAIIVSFESHKEMHIDWPIVYASQHALLIISRLETKW